MSGLESSMQLWVLFSFGPSPSSGQSHQFLAGTVIQSAKLVPPVNLTGELKIRFHWICLPSFLHPLSLFTYYLLLSRSQSFSLYLCLSVMAMYEENNIHNMTLLMNNVPCTCSLKWHHLESDKELKSRLLPVCYVVTEKKETTYKPKADAMQPSAEKLLSRDWYKTFVAVAMVWPWPWNANSAQTIE